MATPNQSFLMKRMQMTLAACLWSLYYDLRMSAPSMAGAWHHTDSLVDAAGWRLDNMDCRAKWSPIKAGRGRVVFKNPRWDPQKSDLHYGKKVIAENVQVTDDAKTKIVRNDTANDLHVAYEEAASITNSFSAAITKGVTLDVTREKSTEKSSSMDASVDAEQKVSGEYMGVTAEASLAEHFGVSKEKSESQSESRSEGRSSEMAKEKAEEGTREESLAIEFDAAPHTNYLVSIVKEHERTEQPFSIVGVMDFDLELHLTGNGRGPHHDYSKHDIVTLNGVDGLEQWLRGWDTRYPEMEGYWDMLEKDKSIVSPRVRYGVGRVLDPAMREIVAEGINYAALESNVDYHVEELGRSIPDDLSHLQQVRAEDLTA